MAGVGITLQKLNPHRELVVAHLNIEFHDFDKLIN